MLESTKSCSSVDSAFYAIKCAHEIAGTDNQVVSRIREDAKNILGAGRLDRKDHLSTDVLKDLVEAADLSNIMHLRNVYLCVLAYADFYYFFFRSEEVLNIRMIHIHFHEGSPLGMIIKVEKVRPTSFDKVIRLLLLNQRVASVRFPY